jgi:DNA invertase Pin-like site-specific DNA recombinase
MRVIVYSRVSTDAQERDGTSLDTQERACLDFARQQDWRVVDCRAAVLVLRLRRG